MHTARPSQRQDVPRRHDAGLQKMVEPHSYSMHPVTALAAETKSEGREHREMGHQWPKTELLQQPIGKIRNPNHSDAPAPHAVKFWKAGNRVYGYCLDLFLRVGYRIFPAPQRVTSCFSTLISAPWRSTGTISTSYQHLQAALLPSRSQSGHSAEPSESDQTLGRTGLAEPSSLIFAKSRLRISRRRAHLRAAYGDFSRYYLQMGLVCLGCNCNKIGSPHAHGLTYTYQTSVCSLGLIPRTHRGRET